MDFNKMKLGKKGKSNATSALTDLMSTVIITSVLGVIVISILIAFAPMVQSKAADAAAAANANNNSLAAGLWSILATDGVYETLSVAVFVIIIVAVFVNIIKDAVKGK